MPDAAERAQVRGTLHAVSLTAWMLIIIDAVSMGGSIGHNITTGHNTTANDQPLGLVSLAAGWLLMLAAMMTPFLTTPVQHLRACNLARRRARAVNLFIAVYLVVWLTAGILLTNAVAALLPLGQGVGKVR